MMELINKILCFIRHDWGYTYTRRVRICARCGRKQRLHGDRGQLARSYWQNHVDSNDRY